MTLRNPKVNKAGKLHMTRIGYSDEFIDDAYAIEELFTDRLPTHTLREVCHYIAGYFHNKIMARDKRIKELQEELEQYKNVSRETEG